MEDHTEYIEHELQIEQDNWWKGDYLIDKCGPPYGPGVKDGAYIIFQQILDARERAGLPDSGGIKQLSQIRVVAFYFPPEKRQNGISWTCHREAGSPEMLAKIIKRVGNKKPTVKLFSDLKKKIEKEEESPKLSKYHTTLITLGEVNKTYMECLEIDIDEGPTQVPMVRECIIVRMNELNQMLKRLETPISHITAVGE